MHIAKCIGGLLILVLSSVSHLYAQGTVYWTVTFDNPPLAPGESHFIPQYTEQGMLFRGIGIDQHSAYELARAGGARTILPDNGTSYIRIGDSLTVRAITAADGSRFGLVSVDIAEYISTSQSATARFIGYRNDGSTVGYWAFADGINDGIGPAVDFQTFSFGPQFADLVKVEIYNYPFALDNFVFSSVPEPGSGTLMLLAAGAFGLRFFKRKS